MIYAKTAAFTADQQQLARVARALAHPARVAIIRFLAAQKTCISGDIAAELPLARTTVSQHLQELKALALIRGEIDGLTVCYCLNTELLQRVHQQFTAFFLEATSGAAVCAPAGTCACYFSSYSRIPMKIAELKQTLAGLETITFCLPDLRRTCRPIST